MRNKLLTRWLMATIFIVFLILASCGKMENESPQKKVTITGLSAYNGMYGFSGLAEGANSVAYSMPELIKDGAVTNSLINQDNGKLFNKNGTYMVVFIICKTGSVNDIENPIWRGYIATRTFTGETTSIPFNTFTKLSIVATAPTIMSEAVYAIIQKVKVLK